MIRAQTGKGNRKGHAEPDEECRSDPAGGSGSGLVLIYTVFGRDDEAAMVATEMVDAGLAACANLLAPCRSVFRWQGGVQTGIEHPVLFKVARARAPALMDAIAQRHSYAVPAIVQLEVGAAHAPFHDWVIEQRPGQERGGG